MLRIIAISLLTMLGAQTICAAKDDCAAADSLQRLFKHQAIWQAKTEAANVVGKIRVLILSAKIPNREMWILCKRYIDSEYEADDFVQYFKGRMNSQFGGYTDFRAKWAP